MKYILYMINKKTGATVRLSEYKNINSLYRDREDYAQRYKGYTFRIKGVMIWEYRPDM